MRGWFMCVHLSPSLYVGKCMCVCVCVLVEAGPWELRVGASWLQQWLLPWQPRRERCVEWVCGRGIYSTVDTCVWGDVALFMNLVIQMGSIHATRYALTVLFVFKSLLSFVLCVYPFTNPLPISHGVRVFEVSKVKFDMNLMTGLLFTHWGAPVD